ncbi:MAG: hypothetical protein R3F11_21835 [Verrucomicrobiales bacterium]
MTQRGGQRLPARPRRRHLRRHRLRRRNSPRRADPRRSARSRRRPDGAHPRGPRRERSPNWASPRRSLVDHGTPQAPVNAIRDHLAAQMKALLGGKYPHLSPCSMERRDGPEYDFNEPLLESLLGSDGFGGEVVVSMLFISPGSPRRGRRRHRQDLRRSRSRPRRAEDAHDRSRLRPPRVG